MQIAARVAILTVVIAAGIFLLPLPEQPDPWKTPGGPRVVAIHELPESVEACEPTYVPVAEDANLFSALGTDSAQAGLQHTAGTVVLDRDPIRQIRDLEPIYGSLGINNTTNEVFLGDANFWSIRVFNRTDNTPKGVPFTPPKRVIRGVDAQIQFINGIYIDPKNGDIYAVETDTGDKIIVFNHDDQGNVKPKREIAVPHRGFSLAVDEEKQEIFVGVHYPPEIAVFPKDASGKDKSIRRLRGESTRLSYVHGMVLDTKQKLMFVANWGRVSDYTTAGTGRFEDPSISVYPMNANGDTAPVKRISGDKTQLDWPSQMAIDNETGEIFVSNDMGHSVLVFKTTDSGNVAPTRVIKGDKTGLVNPLGIAVDKINSELWVVDMANSSASVFGLKANGNVAPIRKIRSAPEGKRSLKFGKVEAMAYDPRRDVVWVPNCVTHPQIAAFDIAAKVNEPPVRTLEGQKTLLSRTMHGMGFDPIHDEIVVNSPLSQAILTFRGGANGEEAPLRFIQGPKTKIVGTGYGALSTVTPDPEGDEIFLPIGNGGYQGGGPLQEGVLVFNRLDNGDVAPKRFLIGPGGQVGIDPVANVMIVKDGGGMSIYDRKANGMDKPLRVIRGPNSMVGGGQITTYPEKGWIITGTRGGGYGVWHVSDNGDVPPRWNIPVQDIVARSDDHPARGAQNVGVALVPRTKELFVASSQSNRVVVFAFPELFQ